MTLSFAWRSEGRIHLASDSRISLGENQYADVGIKVLALPIHVTGTDLGDNGKPQILFQSRYGFCYAGSLVNASTLKDLLAELLRSLQFIKPDEVPSFDTICEMVAKYCGKISTELCAYLAERGGYEFFLAGFCPSKKILRAAHFSLDHKDGQASASFELILEDDSTYCSIGTGTNAARQKIKDVNCKNMLLALNAVIDEQSVQSVGGDIQYGSFDRNANFSISGIRRKSVEFATIDGINYGPTELILFKYRGLQLYQDWEPTINSFWVTPGFIELEVPSNVESNNAFRSTLEI
ncbi:MAG: hypothetical protein V4488_21660 [Pseudomonadota bacterium]